jgi:Leucine-rich repeat (LRR) protein
VQLEASNAYLAAVPASLASLTRLAVRSNQGAQLVLPTTLTCLKELYLTYAAYGSVVGISSLVALEWLDAPQSAINIFGGSLTYLQRLTRLRHLNISRHQVMVPQSFTVIGTLQQLTYLNLSSILPADEEQSTTAGWEALACARPLPALLELDLSCVEPEHSLSMLGPWLGRLTALTKLSMSGNLGSNGNEFLYLPPQLQELDLSSMEGMQRLPLGLLQLSALRVLDLRYNSGLRQLPSWFSDVRCLEVLYLWGTRVVTVQPVLARMPALRCVHLSHDQAAVCEAAPHLRV